MNAWNFSSLSHLIWSSSDRWASMRDCTPCSCDLRQNIRLQVRARVCVCVREHDGACVLGVRAHTVTNAAPMRHMCAARVRVVQSHTILAVAWPQTKIPFPCDSCSQHHTGHTGTQTQQTGVNTPFLFVYMCLRVLICVCVQMRSPALCVRACAFLRALACVFPACTHMLTTR